MHHLGCARPRGSTLQGEMLCLTWRMACVSKAKVTTNLAGSQYATDSACNGLDALTVPRLDTILCVVYVGNACSWESKRHTLDVAESSLYICMLW